MYQEKSGNPGNIYQLAWNYPKFARSFRAIGKHFEKVFAPKNITERNKRCINATAARGTGLPDGIFFKPKIPNWVNFGGSCAGRGCPILRPFGLFYYNLVYFVAIW
jgi:hypothetical protein